MIQSVHFIQSDCITAVHGGYWGENFCLNRGYVSMRYLYVMVSRTDTGFARLIRRFTGCYYNHAAIFFDCDLR